LGEKGNINAIQLELPQKRRERETVRTQRARSTCSEGRATKKKKKRENAWAIDRSRKRKGCPNQGAFCVVNPKRNEA